MCLQLVSVSLAMQNLGAANDYIHKLEHTLRGTTTATTAGSATAGNGSNGGVEADQVLVNMKVMGWIKRDMHVLSDYCDLVREHCAAPLPQSTV